MNLSRVKYYIDRRIRAQKVGYPIGPWQLGRAEDFTSRIPDTFILNGKRIPIRLMDEYSVRMVFFQVILEDEYGLSTFPFPVKSVLDIGANQGIFCLAARNAFPDAVIHSYEPNGALEPYLRFQAEATGAKYYMEAVQKESGFVRLNICEKSVETSSVVDASGDVPATAFRTAIERMGGAVDLVKLDSEGAEWDILEDVDAWHAVRYLLMEYHCFERWTRKDALDRVARTGMRILEHIESPCAPGVGIIKAARDPSTQG